MKESTRRSKQSARLIPQTIGQSAFTEKVIQVVNESKKAFDALSQEFGKMLAETILFMDRENLTGPDYSPYDSNLKKWASQPGSVFIGGQKIKVQRPRVRGPGGEVGLKSYGRLKERGGFSEELLLKSLSGLSGRRYEETVTEAAGVFGVSKSSVSRHIVEATAKRLKEFRERDLSSFVPFSIFMDTIHRGGEGFVVALGIDRQGEKKALGFWEGATENYEICTELLRDLEDRGLKLSEGVVYITDGGKGLIKSLKARHGKSLIHQRCTIHKDRNIQRHLPKKYRKKAHDLFTRALSLTKYEDARAELKKLEKWLRSVNESAADSLNEAFEKILTVHCLKV